MPSIIKYATEKPLATSVMIKTAKAEYRCLTSLISMGIIAIMMMDNVDKNKVHLAFVSTPTVG